MACLSRGVFFFLRLLFKPDVLLPSMLIGLAKFPRLGKEQNSIRKQVHQELRQGRCKAIDTRDYYLHRKIVSGSKHWHRPAMLKERTIETDYLDFHYSVSQINVNYGARSRVCVPGRGKTTFSMHHPQTSIELTLIGDLFLVRARGCQWLILTWYNKYMSREVGVFTSNCALSDFWADPETILIIVAQVSVVENWLPVWDR